MASRDCEGRRLALDAPGYRPLLHVSRVATAGGRCRGHDPVLAQIIEFLRERPSTVVSPYDFEPEFQILLTWLALVSGLGRIRVDANNSRLGAWNGKRMLHPTVESALRLNGQVSEQAAPLILKQEHRASEAFQAEFMARYPAGGRGLQTAFSSRALRRVRRRSARYCRNSQRHNSL